MDSDSTGNIHRPLTFPEGSNATRTVASPCSNSHLTSTKSDSGSFRASLTLLNCPRCRMTCDQEASNLSRGIAVFIRSLNRSLRRSKLFCRKRSVSALADASILSGAEVRNWSNPNTSYLVASVKCESQLDLEIFELAL